MGQNRYARHNARHDLRPGERLPALGLVLLVVVVGVLALLPAWLGTLPGVPVD